MYNIDPHWHTWNNNNIHNKLDKKQYNDLEEYETDFLFFILNKKREVPIYSNTITFNWKELKQEATNINFTLKIKSLK